MSEQLTKPDAGQSATGGAYNIIHLILGTVALLMRTGSEASRVAGEIHHTFSEKPVPWAKDHTHDVRRAPKPYGLVKKAFEVIAHKLQQLHVAVPSGSTTPLNIHRVVSAMNGVLGDKLSDWNHPLALQMDVVNESGERATLDMLAEQGSRGLVLFIHGLCLSEFEWQCEQHSAFVSALKNKGYATGWIRYNTGLPIWENGNRLSVMLDQQLPNNFASNKSLVLVGHSMGGLVIRSACYHAQYDYQHEWLSCLSHAGYLASPHAGAPLEQIGNKANSLLGVSPYSKPLMALGNIRSLGIRSLRYGNVTQPSEVGQEQIALPFNEAFKHLLVAAKMETSESNSWLGDGLVPVPSAMGGAHFPGESEMVRREVFDDVGHIRLLKDERLYRILMEWLELPDDQGADL